MTNKYFILITLLFVLAVDVAACGGCPDTRVSDVYGRVIRGTNFREFPLCGRTWLFGKGSHPHSYSTVSNAVPTHLIMVTFPDALFGGGNGDITIRYANFSGLHFKSTGHLLNEAVRQFDDQNQNVKISASKWRTHTGDTLMSVSWRRVPDTLWSCDAAFEDVSSFFRGYDPQYKMLWDSSGVAVEKIWRPGNPIIRHREKPDAWIETPFALRGHHFPEVNNRITPPLYYKLQGLPSATIQDDYCQDNICREYVDCRTPHLSDFNFWQIHFFPVVKFFPRIVRTGVPILNDKWAMTLQEARIARKISVEEMNIPYRRRGEDGVVRDGMDAFHALENDGIESLELESFRRPYYSDSASCVISVQFQGEWSGVAPEYYTTSLSDTGEDGFDDFHIERLPSRFMYVGSGTSMPTQREIEAALLRLYAEDDVQDATAKGVWERCSPAWKNRDIEIGELHRFSRRSNSEGLPGEMQTITDWETLVAQFDPYSPIVPNKPMQFEVEKDMYARGGAQTRIIMNENYQAGKFTYDGCPCLPISEFTHPNVPGDTITASDLRNFIFRTPPMCNVEAMSNAMYILQVAAMEHITNIDDRSILIQRILLLGDVLERQTEFNKTLNQDMLIRSVQFCPSSWETRFRSINGSPLFRDSFTQDMRLNFLRLKNMTSASNIEQVARMPVYKIGFTLDRTLLR